MITVILKHVCDNAMSFVIFSRQIYGLVERVGWRSIEWKSIAEPEIRETDPAK